MKKLLFYSAIVCTILLLFSGCKQSEKFKVTLNLENADGRTLFLCKTVEGTDVVVDDLQLSQWAGESSPLTLLGSMTDWAYTDSWISGTTNNVYQSAVFPRASTASRIRLGNISASIRTCPSAPRILQLLTR